MIAWYRVNLAPNSYHKTTGLGRYPCPVVLCASMREDRLSMFFLLPLSSSVMDTSLHAPSCRIPWGSDRAHVPLVRKLWIVVKEPIEAAPPADIPRFA